MGKFPDDRDKEIIILALKIVLYGTMTYFAIHKKETETVIVLLKIAESLSKIL